MTEPMNGAEVAYELLGDGGSRVVLLHGWGCDRSLMKPVGNALKAGHQVLLVDFPGHGESGDPPEPWGVPEYAECLKALLEKLGFVPCAVIAHSFGCRIAAWLAAENPGMFDRMVFTGAAGIRPQPSEESLRRSEKYKKLRARAEGLRRIPLMKGAAEKIEEKLRKKYGSRDYNALNEEMRRTFVKVINLDLTELYSRIRASTLLIWGDADTETPLWMGKRMEEMIPDSGLVILEGGSHFAYLEQIDRFNTIVTHFLAEEEVNA